MTKITTEFLETLFTKCNREYFGGLLPKPGLRVSHSKTRLGTMSCKRMRRSTAFTDYKISISDYYVMTDDQLVDVMVHEMIHYYIAYKGLRDTSPHGSFFRTMMIALNRKYHLHVSVSTSTRGWKPSRQVAKAKAPSHYLVLGIRMNDGKNYISSVNPRFASRLELQIRRISAIVEHKWIETDDERFSSFPRVRSLRGRRVTEEEYKKILV